MMLDKILTESEITRLQEKRSKLYMEMMKDKNVYKIEKVKDKCIIYYRNDQIFKCSGWLVENNIRIEFSRIKGFGLV